MKVSRVFNNNIVATITDDKKEAIMQGAGIGFQKKAGDLIDPSKIEKTFYILDEHRNKFNQLFDETPIEFFQVSEAIMEIAESELNVRLSNQILLALTDHIYFATERFKDGIQLPNLMLDEIKSLYRDEYRLALKALTIIQELIHIELPIDEAGYIAMHIVNATLNTETENATNILLFSKGVLEIINQTYQINIKQERLDYSRLMTHLKFLALRIFIHEEKNLHEVEDLYDLLRKKEKRIEACIEEINRFIMNSFDYELSKQEKVYLMIHVMKIVQ